MFYIVYIIIQDYKLEEDSPRFSQLSWLWIATTKLDGMYLQTHMCIYKLYFLQQSLQFYSTEFSVSPVGD